MFCSVTFGIPSFLGLVYLWPLRVVLGLLSALVPHQPPKLSGCRLCAQGVRFQEAVDSCFVYLCLVKYEGIFLKVGGEIRISKTTVRQQSLNLFCRVKLETCRMGLKEVLLCSEMLLSQSTLSSNL